MAATPRPSTTMSLADLPPEVIERVVAALDDVRGLASANAASRLFRGAPGGRSAVEHALRERAARRGHVRALPTALPHDVCTWTEELFARERVLQLARAHSHVAAISKDPHVQFSAFACADGGLRTCGEVDLLDLDESLWTAHAALGHNGDESVDFQLITIPKPVASTAAVRVVAVAVGSRHLLALSDAGDVYGCGGNSFGQLGLGDTRDRHSFAHLRALSSVPVISVDAQGRHSLALTAAGCAYSWGCNGSGQLGHSDTEDRLEPTRIEALDGVRVGGVATGYNHVLLLDVYGAIYSCGSGRFGKLGHGDEQDQHTPRRIEALAGVCAVHVSAGTEHSLVVGAKGSVYSFGDGVLGGLGHGNQRHQLMPKRIEALAGAHAVKASAGLAASAVVCADGSVLAFGRNYEGQLGVGECVTVMQPMQVHVHARVAECCMGRSESLFVTADGGVHVCGQQSAAHGRGVRLSDEAGDLHIPHRIEQLPRV